MPTEIIIKTTVPRLTEGVIRALERVVEETTHAARINIEHETERQHHGRPYPSRREPGAIHIASAPGESFATDTASLINSMKENKVSALTSEIQLNDWRWAVFEFGGGRIAPRPTVIPMFENMQPNFARDCTDAVIDVATAESLAP